MSTDFSYILYLHVSTYWISALFFLTLDYYWQCKGITKYKYLGKVRPFAPTNMIYKAISVSVCNQIIATPCIYYILNYCINPKWDIGNNIQYIPLYFLLYTMLADQWFYWIHRMLHMNLFLYKHIHSIHHQWVFPMAIRAIYTHPLEHIVCNVGSLLIGPLCFPTNSTLLCIWIVIGTLNSVISHSGTKIYMLTDETHDLHHRLLSCNFGVRGICDRLYNTYRKGK